MKPGAKPQKLSDGEGLFLQVQPNGSKLWRLAYRFFGKQKALALGSYPRVTLGEARRKRDEAKRLLADGIDPGAERKRQKLTAKLSAETTFRAVADEWLAKLEREGRADVTVAKKRWLLSLVGRDLGDRPVAELTAPEVLAALRRIEARGRYESAGRARATIGAVCRYAIATGRAENDPTQSLRGAESCQSGRSFGCFTARKSKRHNFPGYRRNVAFQTSSEIVLGWGSAPPVSDKQWLRGTQAIV